LIGRMTNRSLFSFNKSSFPFISKTDYDRAPGAVRLNRVLPGKLTMVFFPIKFRVEFDWTPFGEVPNDNRSGRCPGS
jgi:hypothetical protein